jgi:hypothetical protein
MRDTQYSYRTARDLLERDTQYRYSKSEVFAIEVQTVQVKDNVGLAGEGQYRYRTVRDFL